MSKIVTFDELHTLYKGILIKYRRLYLHLYKLHMELGNVTSPTDEILDYEKDRLESKDASIEPTTTDELLEEMEAIRERVEVFQQMLMEEIRLCESEFILGDLLEKE